VRPTVVAIVVAGSLASVGRAAAPAPRPCAAVVQRGVIPSWARAGFSDARPRLAHTLSRSGQLIALIFGDPLTAPPRKQENNKILWVTRVPMPANAIGDLTLRAQRMLGTRRVGRVVTRVVVGGPGPSIIDLPSAGCWRVDASWWGHRDQIDLRYRPLATRPARRG
jgi:hypothetical protein